MGIVQKKSAIVSFIMLIGVCLAYLNVTILFPKYFTESQIGILRVIISGPSILIPIMLLGLSYIAVMFYPKVKNDKILFQKFYSFAITVPIIVASLIGLILLINYNWFAITLGFKGEALFYSWMILPISILMSYANFYTSMLNNLMKQEITSFFANIWYRISMLFLLILYVCKIITFDHLVLSIIIIYLIQLISVIVIFQKYTGLKFILGFSFIKSYLYKDSLVYGLFSTLNSSAGYIVQNVDVIMTSSILSLKATGVYSTNFFMALMIELPLRAINQSIVPLLSYEMEHKRWDLVKEKYQLTSINQFLMAGVLFLLLWLNIDFIYEIMPNGERFSIGKQVVLFVGLAKIYDMFWGINTEILSLSKYYRWNTWLILFLVVLSVVTNYFLIPIYKITGAAIATFVTVFVVNTARGYIVWRKLNLLPFKWNHIKLFTIFVLVYFVMQYVPVFELPFVNLFFRTFLICFFIGVLVYFTKSSLEFYKIVKKIMKIIVKYLKKVFGI